MTRRTPPEELTPAERRAWVQAYKNRNLHSCKLSDELEANYQTWKSKHSFPSDNAAIRHLLSTHPELQNNG